MSIAPLACSLIAIVSILAGYNSEGDKAFGFWFLAFIALLLAAGTGSA